MKKMRMTRVGFVVSTMIIVAASLSTGLQANAVSAFGRMGAELLEEPPGIRVSSFDRRAHGFISTLPGITSLDVDVMILGSPNTLGSYAGADTLEPDSIPKGLPVPLPGVLGMALIGTGGILIARRRAVR